jgi:hypothetical protein
MFGSKAPQGAQYYCRGCGEKLPPDCHAQFHPACLKADNLRRTQERRQLEQERFLAWLGRRSLARFPPPKFVTQAGSDPEDICVCLLVRSWPRSLRKSSL